MPDRKYREHGLLVRLTVPDDWSAETVEHELAASIGFGQPVVDAIYDVPAQRPETTVSVPDGKL